MTFQTKLTPSEQRERLKEQEAIDQQRKRRRKALRQRLSKPYSTDEDRHAVKLAEAGYGWEDVAVRANVPNHIARALVLGV